MKQRRGSATPFDTRVPRVRCVAQVVYIAVRVAVIPAVCRPSARPPELLSQGPIYQSTFAQVLRHSWFVWLVGWQGQQQQARDCVVSVSLFLCVCASLRSFLFPAHACAWCMCIVRWCNVDEVVPSFLSRLAVWGGGWMGWDGMACALLLCWPCPALLPPALLAYFTVPPNGGVHTE